MCSPAHRSQVFRMVGHSGMSLFAAAMSAVVCWFIPRSSTRTWASSMMRLPGSDRGACQRVWRSRAPLWKSNRLVRRLHWTLNTEKQEPEIIKKYGFCTSLTQLSGFDLLRISLSKVCLFAFSDHSVPWMFFLFHYMNVCLLQNCEITPVFFCLKKIARTTRLGLKPDRPLLSTSPASPTRNGGPGNTNTHKTWAECSQTRIFDCNISSSIFLFSTWR